MTQTHNKTQHIAQHHRFHHVTTSAILATVAVTIWGWIDRENELVEWADYAILGFFAVEVGLRVKAAGRRCWRDAWLMFDLTITVLAILPLGANLTALRIMRIARIAHLGRHTMHLRHLPVLRLLELLGRHLVKAS